MLVKDCNNFNPEYPEQFTWGHLDSISLCNVASELSNHINHDLKTVERNKVPGLRLALNIIAKYAEV